jgi:hypothetical protein
MHAQSRSVLITRMSSARVVMAAATAFMLILTAAVDAQGPEAARRHRDREPVVFTVDVAEDLAGSRPR